VADHDPQPVDVQAALFARIEEAVAAADRLRLESEALIDISTALREGRLTSRCAWCGRYRVGGRWVVVTEIPPLVAYAGTTHTICDNCIEVLQQRGLSV
jgi:hypothetical protein